jgi:hypothetical protein
MPVVSIKPAMSREKPLDILHLHAYRRMSGVMSSRASQPSTPPT